ncbi:hypothetical protein V7S43_012745 [Phytophthora oleae]|uniref:Uncharacterized protein n=1 Tax=Phytophthora oleae TaxID=2107226 RepID=A0ABD3FBM2_9STRA
MAASQSSDSIRGGDNTQTPCSSSGSDTNTGISDWTGTVTAASTDSDSWSQTTTNNQSGESTETPCSGDQSSTGTWGQSTETTSSSSGEQQQQQQGQTTETTSSSTGEQQQQSTQTTVSSSVAVDVTTQGGESAETPCSGDQSSAGTASVWTTPDYKHGVSAGSISSVISAPTEVPSTTSDSSIEVTTASPPAVTAAPATTAPETSTTALTTTATATNATKSGKTGVSSTTTASSGTSSADSYADSTTQQSATQSRRALRH